MKLPYWDTRSQSEDSFVSHYRQMFGHFGGHWPPIINAMLALLTRLEADVEGPPLRCSTSHTTVSLSIADQSSGSFCWFTYGLTFVNGEGRVGNKPAYFLQDPIDKAVHRAETVDEAVAVIVALLQRRENEHPVEDEIE